jgi:hypothetical protein
MYVAQQILYVDIISELAMMVTVCICFGLKSGLAQA